MPFSPDALYGFLLVLARVSGVFALAPLPGFRATPAPARILLSFAITVALAPMAPRPRLREYLFSEAVAWIVADIGFGVAIGLAVALLADFLLLAAQMLGLQAGYAYASTIDPTTEADSGVLQVLAQLASWMLFAAFGMDGQVIRALAASFETYPPGQFKIPAGSIETMLHLGSAMLATAVRLALPIVALLVLVDVAFALLGRINAQLQLLTLTFPVKMLATLAMFAAMASALPTLYQGLANETVAAMTRLAGR